VPDDGSCPAPRYLALVCPADDRAHLVWSHDVVAASIDPGERLPAAMCGRGGCEPYDPRRMAQPASCERCERLARQVDGARLIGAPRRDRVSSDPLDSALILVTCEVGDGCRCSPAERAEGHRHRCPAGPLSYLAVGPWDGMTTEDIEHAMTTDGEA
jgi:hypothetical protein